MGKLSVKAVIFLSVVALGRGADVPILGGSTRGAESDYRYISEAGGTHVRTYALWKHLQPRLDAVDSSLTVEKLRANHTLVSHWAETEAQWSYVDSQIELAKKYNLSPIIEVGEGTFNGIPAFNGTIADPSVIGRDVYIAYQYRAAHAVVDRHGSSCELFQIENELNEAYLSGLGGQRLFRAVGSPWRDWPFLTSLLEALRLAVRDARPGARVTTNLHTDVPRIVHDLLVLPGYYEDAAGHWAGSVDVLSYDAYPNMFSAVPLHPNVVVERGELIAKRSGHQGVFVMETGIPVRASTVPSTVPVIGNFSQAAQADYVLSSCSGVRSAGLGGFMLFLVTAQDGIEPPVGGYTSEDLKGLGAIADLMAGKHVLESVAFLASSQGRDFVSKRLGKDLKVGNGWGVIDKVTGEPRPAFQSLKQCFTG